MTVFAAAFQAACALAALARYSPIASEAGLPLSKNPHFNVACRLVGELAVMVPRAQHDTWRPATREAARLLLQDRCCARNDNDFLDNVVGS